MYSLVWTPEARADAAAAWADAADPLAVLRAVDQAETTLRDDPHAAAVHLSEGLWRLTVAPLEFFFAIDQPARTVTISQVNTVP